MDHGAPVLLNDEQMRQFITDGFLILKTDFSAEFHEKLMEKLNFVYEKEGNPGNNLLPRIRELQKVFDHPVVTGALTSVLGPNYMLHAHRHGHHNASPVAGKWHKDSYWGYKRMRNHHPWWAMIMYFPQDTPVELGPTGIMPGTQNYESRTFIPDNPEGEGLASGKAGTFALIHYDIWHRSTPNVLGEHRYMLKFEFMRTAAPVSPSWNNDAPEWQEPPTLSTGVLSHPAMWEETWSWLSGRISSGSGAGAISGDTVELLAAKLEDAFEPNALNAAYDLAREGKPGVEALLKALDHESVKVSKLAAYGLSVSEPEAAVTGLVLALAAEREETVVHALFALGELRGLASSAVPAVAALLDSPSNLIRHAVVETLGMIGTPVDAVVQGLIRCLQDADAQVRFMAGLSIVKLGEAADAAVPALEAALDDDNRYVSAHAAEALHYIGTDRAKEVLVKFLLGTRWCPVTTPASTFYP
jgi:hypothetical protein